MTTMLAPQLTFFFFSLVFIKFIHSERLELWDKSRVDFSPRQASGHTALKDWEPQPNSPGSFRVCNEVNKARVPDDPDLVQNWLISPQIEVPFGAHFIQMHYSMQVDETDTTQGPMTVYFYESKYAVSRIDIYDLKPLQLINGEYFDLISGNGTLTLEVTSRYVFLAFFDQGYCGQLSINSIYTVACPSERFGGLTVPQTFAKYNQQIRVDIMANNVSCVEDSAVSKTSLGKQIVKNCRPDGSWRSRTSVEMDNKFCECRAGFSGQVSRNLLSCQECERFSVKATPGNFGCTRCAVNSHANYDKTFCDCNPGFYRTNVTNSNYNCYAPPLMPRDIKAIVEFTTVTIRWEAPRVNFTQWYKLRCDSCSKDQQAVFGVLQPEYGSRIMVENLAPLTTYQVVLEVYSDVLAPNNLPAPSRQIEFTTSYKLSVRQPSVSINDNILKVSWMAPDADVDVQYKVEVLVGQTPIFSSGKLVSTHFTTPLPSVGPTEESLSVNIGIVYNGTIYWDQKVFASSWPGSDSQMALGSLNRYMIAIGIMLSMLLLVGILVCGVVCMVHRTRAMPKYDPTQLWTSTLGPHMMEAANFPDYNAYGTGSMHAFVEPAFYDDYFNIVSDFCPAFPPEALQIGQRISGSCFEGELVNPTVSPSPIHCAVKLLPHDSADKRAKRRFAMEAATMAQFHHCNVQNIHGLVYTGESPYMELAVELCGRGSLHDVLNTTPYWGNQQHSTVYFLLRGVTHGMEYLADMGYVHKVLKASSVLVTYNNVCKISGFEERAYLEDNETGNALEDLDLIGWQAPEVLKTGRFGTASDVYSFAVLFWEVTRDCQVRPYESLPPKEVVGAICDGKRLPITADTPQWVETLLHACWTEDPFQRPMFSTVRQQMDTFIINSPKEDNYTCYSSHTGSQLQFSPTSKGGGTYDMYSWLCKLKLEKLSPVLGKYGIHTLDEVLMLKEADLAAIPEINPKQRKRIINSLSQFNNRQNSTLKLSTNPAFSEISGV